MRALSALIAAAAIAAAVSTAREGGTGLSRREWILNEDWRGNGGDEMCEAVRRGWCSYLKAVILLEAVESLYGGDRGRCRS